MPDEMIPDAKLAELLALAEKATPGPWNTLSWQMILQLLATRGNLADKLVTNTENDGAYIAAVHPETIRALVQELQARRKENKAYQKGIKLHAPGWRLKCDSKDIDPVTYENLIDCSVCYNVHERPMCNESEPSDAR